MLLQSSFTGIWKYNFYFKFISNEQPRGSGGKEKLPEVYKHTRFIYSLQSLASFSVCFEHYTGVSDLIAFVYLPLGLILLNMYLCYTFAYSAVLWNTPNMFASPCTELERTSYIKHYKFSLSAFQYFASIYILGKITGQTFSVLKLLECKISACISIISIQFHMLFICKTDLLFHIIYNTSCFFWFLSLLHAFLSHLLLLLFILSLILHSYTICVRASVSL